MRCRRTCSPFNVHSVQRSMCSKQLGVLSIVHLSTTWYMKTLRSLIGFGCHWGQCNKIVPSINDECAHVQCSIIFSLLVLSDIHNNACCKQHFMQQRIHNTPCHGRPEQDRAGQGRVGNLFICLMCFRHSNTHTEMLTFSDHAHTRTNRGH